MKLIASLMLIVFFSGNALCQNQFGLPFEKDSINQVVQETKNHLASRNVDTSKFYFIPVVNARICVGSWCSEVDHNTLTQILFLNKNSKKIEGSFYFCKGQSSYFYYKNSKAIRTMPCRIESRYFMVNEGLYSKLEKIFRKGENGTLLCIEGIDNVFVVIDQKIKIVL